MSIGASGAVGAVGWRLESGQLIFVVATRPDVAAAFGARFQNSGYSKSVSGLAAGEHLFLRYAYSPTNGWFVTTTTNYVDVATVGLTIDRQGAGTGGVTASGLSCAGGSTTQVVPCGATYRLSSGRGAPPPRS